MLEQTFIYLVASQIRALRKQQAELRALLCSLLFQVPVSVVFLSWGLLFPSWQTSSTKVRFTPEEQGVGVAQFVLGKWCLGTLKEGCKPWVWGTPPRKSPPERMTSPHTLPSFPHVTLLMSAQPQVMQNCSITNCYSLWEFKSQN